MHALQALSRIPAGMAQFLPRACLCRTGRRVFVMGTGSAKTGSRCRGSSSKREMRKRSRMGRWAEIRRRLRYTGHLLWRSAVTPMRGTHQRPQLAGRDELGVTFIGHSSFLVQAAGQNLLFDPVFSTWLIL